MGLLCLLSAAVEALSEGYNPSCFNELEEPPRLVVLERSFHASHDVAVRFVLLQSLNDLYHRLLAGRASVAVHRILVGLLLFL